jgi:hypothetical protein
MPGIASAGVTTREIDLTGPTSIEPVGIPAGIVGTSVKGPAFVPLTLPTMNDFVVKFGAPTSIYRNGPLAANEWLRNAQSVTFLRVLGVGDGNQRTSSGNNKGKVTNAGFVVGDRQPETSVSGNLTNNPYAVAGGALGKTYFLATYMSQSSNSTIFTDAGLTGNGQMILRGVLMAASGVVLTLSSSTATSTTPSTSSNSSTTTGATTGSVYLGSGLQEFVMFLNGWNGVDSTYTNVITASFDVSAPNYFGRIFNKDPLKMENAGYYLYTQYDIHPAIAVVTGAGVLGVSGSSAGPREKVAFLVSNQQTWNSGTLYTPNFEGFEDRFQTAKTPWFTSQKFGGRPLNLFQVIALSDGEEPNSKIKISIENIQPSNTDTTNFGTFDLLVRDINDNDNNKIVLEQWRGLSLDVENPRFIGNIIGDTRVFFNFDATTGKQKLTTTGNYPVRSRYIRVSIADDVMNGETPETALPMGCRGFPHLMTSGSSPMPSITDSNTWSITNPLQRLIQPPVPFRLTLTRGTSPTQSTDRALYWGVQFERQESATDPNSSYVPNDTIKSFTKYFGTYHTEWMNPIVSANEGAVDTAENGIVDSDRFNNNAFSLENIKVVYNSTSNLADVNSLESWIYVRAGGIPIDTSAFTRALQVSDLADPTVRAVAKFTVYLQGGFDGTRIFNADTAQLTNKAIVEEMNFSARGFSSGPTVTAYTKALSLMNDVTEVDIQLLAIPGIRHRYVTDTALRVTENRFDALYLFDVEERDTNNTLVTSDTQVISVGFTANDFSSRGVNSSFGAAYFPDVTLRDQFNRSVVRVPPTVAVLGAFSKNDAVAYPWFAPAGFTRGALETTNDPVVRLSRANMDALYSVNINPIVSFAGSTGPVVWGQKTVLARQSSLDRVNVRRLLIALRREVRRIANRILFEQNKEATLTRFSQLVNPIFKRVQDQQGIDNFKVVIDTTTTTEADIENKTIRGKIFLVPTKTLEFLSIDFVLTNRGNFIQG